MFANNYDTLPAYTSLDEIFSGKLFSFFSCTEVINTDLLYEEEKELLIRYSFKRQVDFCKGRYCSRKALEKMGYHYSPIVRDEHGAPIWPEGATGSISHSGDIAAAVVVPNASIQGIGLDIQNMYVIFPSSVLSILLHDDEVSAFLSVPEKLSDLYAYAIFSAKESAIKCFYTIFGYLVNLNEVVVEMNVVKGKFKASVPTNQDAPSLKLNGRIGFNEDYVFSAAWLPR